MYQLSFFEHPILFAIFKITGFSDCDAIESQTTDNSKTAEIDNSQKSTNDKRFFSTVKALSKEDLTKLSDEFIFAKKYDLTDDVLGSGNYAVVKLARQKGNRHKVAVKCIDTSKISEKEKKIVEREVTIYRSLSHPNILQCHDFFTTNKHMYIVLEYLGGGELFDQIVKHSFYTEGKARDVIKTIIDAISHCHNKNIAHRDLKPENILLQSTDDNAPIKIADFGFASVCDGDSLTDSCGSAYYVAPEIIRRVPYGVQVDMWAIGVISYMLLAGYPPFQHPNQRKLFASIVSGIYTYDDAVWAHVSPRAKNFIDRLLVVDPAKRMTAAQALAHPWVSIDMHYSITKPLLTIISMAH
jgi:calcium/calmodulin-dependent protein kinase I